MTTRHAYAGDEDWSELRRVIKNRRSTPVEILRTVGKWRRLLDAIEKRAVVAARSSNVTWGEIGEALGKTRQASWSQYQHLSEELAKEFRRSG